jgi:4Fe-4S single cluster domain
MHLIPRLDVMVAYSCNLACRGCISLSDFKRDGIEPYEDLEFWIDYWSKLVTPITVTLFGGEPMLHPRVLDICAKMRQSWPSSKIRLITNGYFLDRVDPILWYDFAPIELQISIHRADHADKINEKIKHILTKRKGWRVHKLNQGGHEQFSWEIPGFRLYKSIFKDFLVPYRQIGTTILPWNSDPAQAHAICAAPDSPVLYRGRLYKCPAVANAIDVSGQNWFDYRACESELTLNNFVADINRPEPVCAQCPNNNQAVRVNHFDINNVSVKQKNIN